MNTMTMKSAIAALLSGAMLCAGGLTALAAEDTVPAEIPTYAQYSVGKEAVITELAIKSGAYSSVTVQTTDKEPQEIVLHFGADTILMDTQTGLSVNENDLKKGEKVYVYHDMAMTYSLPPQTHAQAILVNLDDKHVPAHLLTAEQAHHGVNGETTIMGDSGGMIVTIPSDTPIAPLRTKNVVTNADIKMGTRLFAWYDIAAMSYPGQATATKVVLLPAEDRIDINMQVGSGKKMLDAKAKLQNGIVMVPVRAVGEALGFTLTWDNAAEAVHMTNGKVQTNIVAGKDQYYMATAIPGMDGMSKPSPLGAAPYVVDPGVTWVPAQLFALLNGQSTVTFIGNTVYFQ